jgi:hypothetical protein
MKERQKFNGENSKLRLGIGSSSLRPRYIERAEIPTYW